MHEPPVENARLAELLALASEEEEGHRARSLRRAAWYALSWDEEATVLAEQGRLTELRAVGPWVAARIEAFLEDPPETADPPPLRHGFLSLAHARRLVADRPELRDALRGDLQMHTTFSDGRASLSEMVSAAEEHGHSHVAITDHSKGLRIARGMDEQGFAGQDREIESLNAELAARGRSIRALRAIEANLSPEGKPDMEPSWLRQRELVLGAFHSKLRETDDQTERYLAALRGGAIDVLAHPRGRKFNQRLGLRADWPRVMAAAAELGVAVEVDAFADRQDLDVELLAVARDAGAWVSVGTDAHRPEELRFIEIGVATVILTGFPRERVLNFLSREELLAWVVARRSRVGGRDIPLPGSPSEAGGLS
ncbi:MAG: PHP domain-containing protein [Actinomycetota bacterium]